MLEAGPDGRCLGHEGGLLMAWCSPHHSERVSSQEIWSFINMCSSFPAMLSLLVLLFLVRCRSAPTLISAMSKTFWGLIRGREDAPCTVCRTISLLNLFSLQITQYQVFPSSLFSFFFFFGRESAGGKVLILKDKQFSCYRKKAKPFQEALL